MLFKELYTSALCCLALTSCISINRPLYSWYKYEDVIHSYTRTPSEDRLGDLTKQYQSLIDKQTQMRRVPPPGICAEYGYLLLKTGKKEEGLKMLRLEIEHYPESSAFISQLIKQFS